MKFSTKLPDKEGYYWVKESNREPTICKILKLHDGRLAIDESGMFSVDVKFAGPIKEVHEQKTS